MVKNPPANAEDTRDVGLISGFRRPPWRGNGNPLQYSCLENSLDRGVWWAIVHGVPELDTTEQLSLYAHMNPYSKLLNLTEVLGTLEHSSITIYHKLSDLKESTLVAHKSLGID